jgi:hypothetical protein
MRTVNRFIVLFVPIGIFSCAISPFVDAALYLMVSGTLSALRPSERGSQPHHSKGKGHSLDWHGCEVLVEDDAVIILVLEPHEIDGLLEHRVSIWAMRTPIDVVFLYAYMAQCVAYYNVMGRTRYMKVILVNRVCARLALQLMLSGERLVLNSNKNSTAETILSLITIRSFILLSTN